MPEKILLWSAIALLWGLNMIVYFTVGKIWLEFSRVWGAMATMADFMEKNTKLTSEIFDTAFAKSHIKPEPPRTDAH